MSIALEQITQKYFPEEITATLFFVMHSIFYVGEIIDLQKRRGLKMPSPPFVYPSVSYFTAVCTRRCMMAATSARVAVAVGRRVLSS